MEVAGRCRGLRSDRGRYLFNNKLDIADRTWMLGTSWRGDSVAGDFKKYGWCCSFVGCESRRGGGGLGKTHRRIMQRETNCNLLLREEEGEKERTFGLSRWGNGDLSLFLIVNPDSWHGRRRERENRLDYLCDLLFHPMVVDGSIDDG